MPVRNTEYYATIFYSATTLLASPVANAFRFNPRNSNIMLAHALKRFAKEQAGECLADNDCWIVCGADNPQRTVDFVLSCTRGPTGNYPIFIFSPLPFARFEAHFLFPRMERLAQALRGAVPLRRVYSVFAPNPVAHEFARLWSKITGVATLKQPYYAAKLTFCTSRSFINRQLTIRPDFIYNLRLAEEPDIPKVAPLCYGFAKESEPFVLSEAGATVEAELLVRNRQLWVHEIQLPGGSEIASIVAVTRESDSVAAITKVFTNPQWRQKRCAERLVRRVCKHFLASKQSVILYVAHDNLAANKVYHRVGFAGLDVSNTDTEIQGVDPWVEIGFDREVVELGHCRLLSSFSDKLKKCTILAVSIVSLTIAFISESNLSTALSLDLRAKLGITHIISVCPEYASAVPNHLTIPVNDSEYEDLLIHLPNACRFIQSALDEDGKVLVHCVMGVSRSTTVVCAYLMWARHLSASAAIRFVKQRRPRVHPNYGFMKQLQAFAKCDYEPSSTNEAYRQWKRKQEHDVTNFINKMLDTTPILPDQLFLSSDFPEDPEQAESLLLDLGMTHLLSLSPARTSSAVLTSAKHHHINIPSYSQEALLLALPDACKYIHNALEGSGQILVHCLAESRACTVVCAYLMSSRHIPPSDAVAILEDALPLFNPTYNFSRHLDLFGACGYTPTSDNSLVKEWLTERDSALGKLSNAAGAEAGSTAITAVATQALSETNYDMTSRNTMARIQMAGLVGQGLE